MAIWVTEQIPCHGCGAQFSGRTFTGIGATRHPEIADEIVAGTLHRFTCPECERSILVEKPFCYTDLSALHCVLVHPRSQLDSWARAERDILDLYRRYIVEEPTGQLFTAADHERFKVRAVFGYERLREKLILWREDIDDRIIEVAKLHLLAKQPYFMDHGYVDLVAVEVSRARDVLTFVAIPPRAAQPLTVSGTLTIYRQLEAAADALADEHPGLFGQPFVDYRRYGDQ